MAETLSVVLAGRPLGSLRRSAGTLTLSYDDVYVSTARVPDLSLSLPRSAKHHTGPVVANWLGLDAAETVRRARRLAAAVPQAIREAADGLAYGIRGLEPVGRLVASVERHARVCALALEG